MKKIFTTVFILSTLAWTEFLPSGHKNIVPRPVPHPSRVVAVYTPGGEDDSMVGDILTDTAIFDQRNAELGI